MAGDIQENSKNAMKLNEAAATDTDEYFRSLPPGYRFNPTDRELILYYLNRKILNQPLPLNRIHDVNIYHHHPQKLSEEFDIIREDGWYFFSTRERKYLNGSRPNRAALNGKWKATGSSIRITDENGELIGEKRVLDFRRGTHAENTNTEWKMHEYSIPPNDVVPLAKRKKGQGDMKLDVVLCKIYINTRSNGKADAITRRGSNKEIKQEADQAPAPAPAQAPGNKTAEGLDNMHHMMSTNSSTTSLNCLYTSTSTSNGVCDSTQLPTHYGASMMTNDTYSSSSAYHQSYVNHSMYQEQIPSYPTTCYSTDMWTQSETENHEVPLGEDSVLVSLPAAANNPNIIDYDHQSMLVTNNVTQCWPRNHHRHHEMSLVDYDSSVSLPAKYEDEMMKMPAQHVNEDEAADDDDVLQFLSIPDDVVLEYDSRTDGFHPSDAKTDELHKNGSRTNVHKDDPGQNRLMRKKV